MYYTEQQFDDTLIALRGELDFGHRTAVKELLEGAKGPNVVIDLTAVTYLETAVINEFLRFARDHENCWFVISQDSHVARIVSLLELDSIVDVRMVQDPTLRADVTWSLLIAKGA